MAEVFHVDVRKKFDLEKVNFSLLDDLPEGVVSLAATVQYIDLIEPVKKYFEGIGRKVIVKKGAFYEGHVLGCNPAAFDKKCDVFVLLCDGKFHAINNAILLNREVYVFNSVSLEKVLMSEIQDYFKKLDGKKKKFLVSDKVGVLVTVKYGQNMKNVLAVKERLEALGKTVYVFESDNIDIGEFENYKQIGIFVNTACSGLARDDARIINLQDVVEFF